MDVEHLLLENTRGWKSEDIKLTIITSSKITGDLQQSSSIEPRLRKPLEASYQFTKLKRPGDFNGLKVSVQKISKARVRVHILAGVTDYFTLWGIPYAAPALLKKSNKELISSGETKLPCGFYTANLVVTSDDKVVMGIISKGAGFGAGRLSFGFEEQMEIDDANLVQTAVRGFKEEIGADILKDDIRILGFGKSLDIAYVAAYCLVKTKLASGEIIERKKIALDKDESALTLAVPLEEIEALCKPRILLKAIKKYSPFKSDLPGDGNSFLLHHRANWLRWVLLKRHLKF